jgi:peptidylprolyl isomerase
MKGLVMKITRVILICTLIVTSLLIASCGGEEQVAKAGDTVSVHYVGTLDDGTVFDSSRERGEPYSFVVGAGQNIIGFDNAVVGMKAGEIKTVTLPPEEAYGYPSDDFLFKFSRDELPEGSEPEVGQLITLSVQGGGTIQKPIVEVTDTYIIVDANNELAGKTLTFEIELLSIQSGD